MPDLRFFSALEATWPPAETALCGPFRLRRGAGGGQRVSAASGAAGILDATQAGQALGAAEAQMRAWGQRPLFMLRGPQEAGFDDLLAARGYEISDPTLMLAGPVAPLLREELPLLGGITTPLSLAICREIWAEAGVGPARQALMERITGPAVAVMGRQGDAPAAVALAAADGPIAMVHALYVRPKARRSLAGYRVMLRAAHWAARQGCETLAVAVVAQNAPARGLYERLGLRQVAAYHYRVAPEPEPLP